MAGREIVRLRPVESRPATEAEIPANARRLAAEAVAHGYRVICTYAKAAREDGTVVESIAVRMHGPAVLVGVFTAGKFTTGIARSRTFTLGELRAAVRGELRSASAADAPRSAPSASPSTTTTAASVTPLFRSAT